ncbi:unnamed protein product [Closterium sp. Naga37s-1]|nr:unnamed protein product [Closterium sp. Naga37s-1]
MIIELKGMVDSKVSPQHPVMIPRLELKVGRNNSKERGIVDESRKLKATTLVVGTNSRGIFGIRGRTGVGAYCMKNRPPTVSVYVVLKDKVTACREADSLPGSSSSAPTSPGHLLVASSAPFRHSPSMSAHHQSDRSSTRSSSGVLEPTDGLGSDDAALVTGAQTHITLALLPFPQANHAEDDEAARTNGAQPPGADYPSSPNVHAAPQPSRAGTWPHDHAGATLTTPDGIPGFQTYSPGLAVPHGMPGASPIRNPGDGGDLDSMMQMKMQQLQLQNQQQMLLLQQQQQLQQLQQQQQMQLQQVQQRLQRDYLAEVDAWRRANPQATPEQQQAFMADLEARMAQATAALAGMPLHDAAARLGGNQQARPEPGGSPQVAAAQGVAREADAAARIGQMAADAERARAAAEEGRRAAEEEVGRRGGERRWRRGQVVEEERRGEGNRLRQCRGGECMSTALHSTPCLHCFLLTKPPFHPPLLGLLTDLLCTPLPPLPAPPSHPSCAVNGKQAATENFSAGRKLGEGGFGTVYCTLERCTSSPCAPLLPPCSPPPPVLPSSPLHHPICSSPLPSLPAAPHPLHFNLRPALSRTKQAPTDNFSAERKLGEGGFGTQAATDNFSAARKLGEGGFGTVYSGTLHHTPVAVKLLKSQDSIQAMAEFQQEVEILSQIQHPHVLMLLGCCPDRYVLVYEYLANGSLEDRLLRLHSTPPLPWFVRIRIAAEIASSLLILHTRPVPIVHRDLKPGNILLDKNFVAKLGDVGLAKLMPGLSMEKTCDRESTPVGTFAYVDPEFQRTGEFGPKSDVYAFGIVLLDLLTGRTPALYEALEIAVESNRNDELMRFLDAGAGTWPQGMAMEIAKLAIQCSEMKRRKRPDLETEVMPILDRMRSVAIKAEEDAKKASLVRPVAAAPPCLFCPITQELMVNPVIAADGHTYELVAIQQWLEKSDRSPMTNVRLPSKALVPNRALKSMILDWRETGGSG